MKVKIIAKCLKCGSILHESIELSKSQLRKKWDKAVLAAVYIPCKRCSHKFPNFDIKFEIKDVGTGRVYKPSDLIKVNSERAVESITSMAFDVYQKKQALKEPDLHSKIQQTLELRKLHTDL